MPPKRTGVEQAAPSTSRHSAVALLTAERYLELVPKFGTQLSGSFYRLGTGTRWSLAVDSSSGCPRLVSAFF